MSDESRFSTVDIEPRAVVGGDCLIGCNNVAGKDNKNKVTLACHIVNNTTLTTGTECCWDLFNAVAKRMEGKTGSMSDLQDQLNQMKEQLDKLQTGTGQTEIKGGEELEAQIYAYPLNWSWVTAEGSTWTAPAKGSIEAFRFTQKPVYYQGSVGSNCELRDTSVRVRNWRDKTMVNELYTVKDPQEFMSFVSFHLDMEKDDTIIMQYQSLVYCEDSGGNENRRDITIPIGQEDKNRPKTEPEEEGVIALLDPPFIKVELRFRTATYTVDASNPVPRSTMDVGSFR